MPLRLRKFCFQVGSTGQEFDLNIVLDIDRKEQLVFFLMFFLWFCLVFRVKNFLVWIRILGSEIRDPAVYLEAVVKATKCLKTVFKISKNVDVNLMFDMRLLTGNPVVWIH
jgi:hypothetical protein